MKDLKIYVTTIIISLILIILSLFCSSSFTNVLSGIGCSGIAAAIMAIFLDKSNSQRECLKAEKAKALYFNQLYDQLIITIERILWYKERIANDSFNWELPDATYSTMNYMVAVSSQYPTYLLTYDEAIERLRDIGERYSLENIKLLDADEVHKVNRLFQIVAAGASYLIMEANAIKENKLILEIEDYLSIEDNKTIMFNISLAFGLMPKTDKNYKAVIDSLISVTNKLREVGKYTSDVHVGLHGSVSISEL